MSHEPRGPVEPQDAVGEHELPERHRESHDRANRFLFLVIGIALGALLVVGILAFQKAEDNKDAVAQAHKLESSLRAAGLRVPVDTDTIVHTFGDDGGPMCETAGTHLSDALLDQQFSNGAAGPGMRPITADPDIYRSAFIALLTYCPEKVEAFGKAFGDYDFDSVATGRDVPDHPEINVIK